MLTIDRLIELKGVIKWNAVFGQAGLNPNTMRSAVHHRRELRLDEAEALIEVLKRYGVALHTHPVGAELCDEPGGLAEVSERTPKYIHSSND